MSTVETKGSLVEDCPISIGGFPDCLPRYVQKPPDRGDGYVLRRWLMSLVEDRLMSVGDSADYPRRTCR